MKYFLATYVIIDGGHEHTGAVIFQAETQDEALKLAEVEEYDMETDNADLYFSYGGDGMTVCKYERYHEITKGQMAFLEKVGLAYRK